MKKTFKILNTLLLPTIILTSSIVAIPLSSCSSKNNENSDKITCNFNWSGTQDENTLTLDSASQALALVSNITINGITISEDEWNFEWSSSSNEVQFSSSKSLTTDCINFNTTNDDIKTNLILKATNGDETFTIINKTLIIKGQDTTPFEDLNYSFHYQLCNDTNYTVGSLTVDNMNSENQFTRGLTINLTRDDFINVNGSQWIYIDNGFKDTIGDQDFINDDDYAFCTWSIPVGQSVVKNSTTLSDDLLVGFQMQDNFDIDNSVISFKYHLNFNESYTWYQDLVPENLKILVNTNNNITITVNYSPFYNK